MPSSAAGFSPSYDLSGNSAPAGVSIIDITIDGRAPRYPETFIDDLDGDGIPEFVAFPGGNTAGVCRPLLIALSTVRTSSNIDSSDPRYITITDANGTVTADSFCTDIETFSTIGDLNGDGYADFALNSRGARVLQGLQSMSGNVRLADLNGTNGFSIANTLLRHDLGDINGDGLDDLSLIQFNDSSFSIDSADHYVLSGKSTARPSIIYPDNDVTGELIGTLRSSSNSIGLVLPLGDVNGDAIDDLMVQSSDSAIVVYGALGLTLTDVDSSRYSANRIGRECGFFGCSALTDFDFDADGYNDIAISFGHNTNSPSSIIYGGPDGLPAGETPEDIPADRHSTLTGPVNLSSGFVGTWGDLNNDGADDPYFFSLRNTVVLFGTPGRRLPEISVGSIDGSNGFLVGANQILSSDALRPRLIGRRLSADLSGDGIDDWLDGQILINGMEKKPVGLAPLAVLVRHGPQSADLYWQVLDDIDQVSGFSISIGNKVLVSLPATADHYRIPIKSRNDIVDVRFSVIGFDGKEIGFTSRRIHPYGEGFGMQANVYGPNLLELIWDAPADDYLVWRDGEVYTTANGQSFLDTDVSPGIVHDYFVTALANSRGPATASYLNSLEGRQRRSTAISIGPPPRHEPPGPNEPVDPRPPTQRPNTPRDLSGTVYSSTAIEVFWSRSIDANIVRYDIYRDARFVASVPGPSWFDNSLNPSSTYRYAVVAVDSNGTGSVASSTLQLSTPSGSGSAMTHTVTDLELRGSVYSSTALELFWRKNVNAYHIYVVSADGEEIGRSNGNSFFVDELDPATRYVFSVSGMNSKNDQLTVQTISLTTR